MPQIIPIKELKNTAEISERCHASNEPIFITKNGYGDMVLMSMEMYETQIKREMMYRELEISERQVKEGKVENAKTVVSDLRGKYGL
ncbi:MAG: type II toxin-antitoxin system Phd/YefM family antitoxin [Firmicutes bacterium]|nr:type II toxin-antitoxin system Phd/YefM family antitoxin [Bacillota bacterium]